MFAFLWGATLYCWLALRFRNPIDYKTLWGWDAVNWENLKPILLRWIVASLGMLAFLYFYNESQLFSIWNHNRGLIPYLLLMYPILSALPQEFIFCSFFFRRYKIFFGEKWMMIGASAATFAYAHMLYINPIAPTISLIGGLIFAYTYSRHKSLALVTIEHGLYGNSLFLIGLGTYFYSGGIPSP